MVFFYRDVTTRVNGTTTVAPKFLDNLTLFQVKFGFSEKATKFEKIFVVLLTIASCSVPATAYLSKS